MVVGINDTLNVTILNIEKLLNITSPAQLPVRVNHYVFGDALAFILLWVFFGILFLVFQKTPAGFDQPLSNALVSSAICSVLAILMRIIEFELDGVMVSLVSDAHMWVFCVVTIVLLGVLWFTKKL